MQLQTEDILYVKHGATVPICRQDELAPLRYHAGEVIAWCNVLVLRLVTTDRHSRNILILLSILQRNILRLSLQRTSLRLEANKWELSHGGISGRTAQQFINHLIGVADD